MLPRIAAPLLVLLMVGAPLSVEQTSPGTRPPAVLVASFDGLGFGFEGPQGTATFRNPSDNSIAVGREHVVQTVNSRMAIFTKMGRALYGPMPTNTLFRDFGGACEATNNGDAVVRYDQLADRWLVVMPIFRRGAERPDQPAPQRAGEPAQLSVVGRPGQPGTPHLLHVPDTPPPPHNRAAARADSRRREAPIPCATP